MAVLITTARDAVPERVAGLDCGADDYIVKPFSLEELMARVRAQIRRAHGQHDPIIRISDLEVDTKARTAHRGGQLLVHDVLDADVDGQPEGFRQRGIVGTVLEGSLQSADVIKDLLAEVQERRSKPAKTVETGATRESHYEKLADWFEEHVDVALFDELYMK